MPWFKTRYVQYLEKEISRLQTENSNLRIHADRLVERLLRKHGSPSVELPAEPTKEAMDRMLQSTDIFEDVEDIEKPGPKPVDNRYEEKFDEFATGH